NRNEQGDWLMQQVLDPDGNSSSDNFGASVAIQGDTLVVGASHDAPSGAAHIFKRDDNGIWLEHAKLLQSDGGNNDVFGAAVVLDDDSIIVGARGDDDNGSSSGSAYIFDAAGAPAFPADITGPRDVPDGCVDAFDLGAMLGAWCSAVNDPNPPSPPCENCTPANLAVADISGAGNAPDGCIDAFDLAKLLAEWCSVAGGNPCGTCQ
ncbi:MAG: FG-GAP repeat protein, partial [Planctomycetota bacterium]|nr:FG-GAP repeat protein [Planctomycetota bacterium]